MACPWTRAHKWNHIQDLLYIWWNDEEPTCHITPQCKGACDIPSLARWRCTASKYPQKSIGTLGNFPFTASYVSQSLTLVKLLYPLTRTMSPLVEDILLEPCKYQLQQPPPINPCMNHWCGGVQHIASTKICGWDCAKPQDIQPSHMRSLNHAILPDFRLLIWIVGIIVTKNGVSRRPYSTARFGSGEMPFLRQILPNLR